ncbi:MAG: hypothetical protein R3288_01070 [Woeseiaceae bacterium]|nr:hypothetical protein [Woeseiaceae bacterium]
MSPAVTQASAPGKVVLSGEYAVLDGATAVAMAVNRRASARVVPAAAPSLECRGVVNVADDAVIDAVCRALGTGPPRAAIVLDTRGFVDAGTGRKLGLGSSAALCVALAAALGPAPHSVLDIALRAHAGLQAVAGSGVDVATSVAGGLVSYRIGEPPQSLRWPDDLAYQLLWSGVPSSTRARLASFAEQGPSARRTELCAAADALADHWRAADSGALVAAYRDYVATLAAFDVDHELGIFDAGHGMLQRANKPDSVVYKPCGAGGGDIGIALGTDPEAVAAFADLAAKQGFRRLDCRLDLRGARLEDGRG